MSKGLSDRMRADLTAESNADESVEPGNGPDLFQIRAQLHTLVSLRLIQPRDERFFLVLQEALARSPEFFRHAPVVMDAGPVAAEPPPNLAELARRLRQQYLVPVGIQNGSDAWNRMAINAGLSVLPAGRPGKLAAQEAPQEPPPPDAPPQPAETSPRASATIVVSEPVRAGQQVYARNGDLIALAPVSPGAELLADGHVHVYSSLRGRAHAGVTGDEDARIFCHRLEAQLVSIAGVYQVNEEIDTRFLGKRVQVRCLHGDIVMEHLP